MTKIDKELVDKIAHLARLEFENEAKDEIMNDMNNMLSFVEKLNEIDTTGVEPLTHMSAELNHLREDKVTSHLEKQSALKNAPSADQNFFRVPRIIE